MRGTLAHIVWRIAAVLMLAWMAGMLPVAWTPVGEAQAGFFEKAKDKQDPDDKPAAAGEVKEQPSTSDKGGFFDKATQKPDTQNQPAAASPSPSSGSAPSASAQSRDGLFGRADGSSTHGATPPSATGPTTPAVAAKSILGAIRPPLLAGRNGRGYFEQAQRERARRDHASGAHDGHRVFVGWYYPFDFGFDYWVAYPNEPWDEGPFYEYWERVYPAIKDPAASAPASPAAALYDLIPGETYVSYRTWPSHSLVEARRDIEQAWRQGRIELLRPHLDANCPIASYSGNQYTHGLTADDFAQLTLDAFATIQTVSFKLGAPRYVSTPSLARIKGVHVFTDPYHEPATVYVSYLLQRVDSPDGSARWLIREVRQAPGPTAP